MSDGMKVTAELGLNSTGFDAGMKRSGEIAEATGRQAAKAAKMAAEAQAFAAKFAGDVVDAQALRQVAANKTLSAAYADVRKSQSLAKVGYLGETESATLAAKALQRLVAAKLESAAASNVEKAATESAGHASVSQMQATSAAVRSLEGNAGIRSVERFLTIIPGVGAALQVAFPVIGAVAFAGVVVEMIDKVREFIRKAKEMPEAIREGYQEMNTSASLANDAMRLVNDNLENAAAKLEKKPENMLAVALHETWIEADKLSKSLDEDMRKTKQFLEQNRVGTTAGALTGQETTADVEGTVNYYKKQMSDRAAEKNYALHQGDSAGAAAAQAKLDDAKNHYADWLKSQIQLRTSPVTFINNSELGGVDPGTKVSYGEMHGDPTANLNILRGESVALQDRTAGESLQQQHGTDTVRLKADEEKKAAAAEAKRRNAELLAERRKAVQEQMAVFDQELRARQQEGPLAMGAEVLFWRDKLQGLRQGSSSYIGVAKEINDKLGPLTQAFFRDMNRVVAAGAKQDEQAMDAYAESSLKAYYSAGKAAAQNKDSYTELAVIYQKNAAAMAELNIKDDEHSGKISRTDAAQKLAALSASNYAAELGRLKQKLADVAAADYLNPEEKSRQAGELQQRIATTQGAAAMDEARSGQAIAGSTGLGGATDALQEFIAATRDSARMMHSFVDTALSGFNAEAVKGMSGQRTSFGNYGAGLARDVSGMALQKGEGALLGMVGLGGMKKPTGTKSDPLYVSSVSGAASGGLSGVAALFHGSSSSSSDSGSGGGGVGGFFGGLLKMFAGSASGGGGGDSGGSGYDGTTPMLANGGPLGANTMAIVGERGPELFMPSVSGHIIPNHKLGVGGGTTGGHTFHVDARGAHDPAQVELAVHRGILAAAPHIAAAAIAGNKEQRLRVPTMHR